MIHYHGLPITPLSTAFAAINRGHAFVSFRYAQQLNLAMECCQSFAVDNGAFSSWKNGEPVTDWGEYYRWVQSVRNLPSFDFAVIPDKIDGTESENDALVNEWPWGYAGKDLGVGAPVWHMHESFSRLERLSNEWPRICVGSSGEFATVGNPLWWMRMEQAMRVLCGEDKTPVCKVHGLRMLNPKVFSRLPLASADSTNIAQNVGIDSAWKGTYLPPSKDSRAAVMRDRIESYQSCSSWPPEVQL